MNRVVVFGAGAVGCSFGGMLARAGRDVVLIGRPDHVEAIRADGLRLQTTTFDEVVPSDATDDPGAVEGADAVLCCVKSAGIEQAGELIAAHLTDDAFALGLQNGVDNADRLQVFVTAPVLPAVVYVATEMVGPGHVRHHGRGDLVIGAGPDADRVVELFFGSGVTVRISDDVVGELWTKLVVNCAFNAVSALTHRAYGELWPSPGVAEAIRGVVDECLTVADAVGVEVAGDPWAATEAIVGSMPNQFSSTSQDLERGRPTEIDHLNGYIARVGATHGVPTPRNHLLWALVRLLELPRDDSVG